MLILPSRHAYWGGNITMDNKLKKFFFPYIPAMVNILERWLSRKALDGWRLENACGWIFVFRKCTPYKTRFFAYNNIGTSKGIAGDYALSKRLYARRKSPINKQNHEIYEVDVDKIDKFFETTVLLRNKFYLKRYFIGTLFSIIFILPSIYMMMVHHIFIVFVIFWGSIFLYSLVSIFIMIREILIS